MTDFFTAPSKAKSDVATTSHSLNDDTASRCASLLQEDDFATADDCNIVSAYKILKIFRNEMICLSVFIPGVDNNNLIENKTRIIQILDTLNTFTLH